MTTFYINFDGYCEIDAETPEGGSRQVLGDTSK